MSTPYKPAWWLPGPHLQTIWPSKTRRTVAIDLIRERLTLPDGDFLDLDWTTGNEGDPLVLMLHGLEGSIHSHYAKGMLAALQKNGMRGLFMHFRSCSGEMNRNLPSYHAGDTKDLRYVLEILQPRYPTIAAIGVSLGGNVLLKYLGETGLNNPISAAVAVSVPFNLSRTADKLDKGFSSIYQKHLLSSLQKKIAKKKVPEHLKNVKSLKSLRDFDHHFTAPVYGFSSGEDYYKDSSSCYYIPKITKKTLIIQARNDPFLPKDAIPDHVPPNVELEVYDKGGHVGFMTGSVPWKATHWLEDRIPAYIKLAIES